MNKKSTFDKQLKKLRKSQRKGPKKRIGTLNVLTGKMRIGRYPDFLRLDAEAYDELLALVRWIEQMPEFVEFPDGAWEYVNDKIVDLVDFNDTEWPGVYVDSVQIETVTTSERNITPGTLVVLLCSEEDTCDQEHHCVLVRGG